MKKFLHGKRFPEYLRRTIDLKNVECAQPVDYVGIPIMNLLDDATFCQEGNNQVIYNQG